VVQREKSAGRDNFWGQYQKGYIALYISNNSSNKFLQDA